MRRELELLELEKSNDDHQARQEQKGDLCYVEDHAGRLAGLCFLVKHKEATDAYQSENGNEETQEQSLVCFVAVSLDGRLLFTHGDLVSCNLANILVHLKDHSRCDQRVLDDARKEVGRCLAGESGCLETLHVGVSWVNVV